MIVILRVCSTVREYPRQFWVLFVNELINAAGAGLVFPFISLYLSRRLNFSMTDVGMFFGLYAIVSTFSQLAGGSLAKGTSHPFGCARGVRAKGGWRVDRIGRKPVMLFSMFGNALSVLGFGLGGALAPACLTDISAADMVI